MHAHTHLMRSLLCVSGKLQLLTQYGISVRSSSNVYLTL